MEQERRHSEREWIEKRLQDLSDWVTRCTNNQGAAASYKLDDVLTALSGISDTLAIPTRDIPTVEELLAQAKTDNSKRELLQRTLAEMEFESVEVEYP